MKNIFLNADTGTKYYRYRCVRHVSGCARACPISNTRRTMLMSQDGGAKSFRSITRSYCRGAAGVSCVIASCSNRGFHLSPLSGPCRPSSASRPSHTPAHTATASHIAAASSATLVMVHLIQVRRSRPPRRGSTARLESPLHGREQGGILCRVWTAWIADTGESVRAGTQGAVVHTRLGRRGGCVRGVGVCVLLGSCTLT